eukprot:GHVP01015003.1.p1 GENE.GHVP01015003.1~~GHVP01015003.1.p1  ORF type:complete len:166 (-),score=36.77 GHVP01015003.1:113-610(-)
MSADCLSFALQPPEVSRKRNSPFNIQEVEGEELERSKRRRWKEQDCSENTENCNSGSSTIHEATNNTSILNVPNNRLVEEIQTLRHYQKILTKTVKSQRERIEGLTNSDQQKSNQIDSLARALEAAAREIQRLKDANSQLQYHVAHSNTISEGVGFHGFRRPDVF